VSSEPAPTDRRHPTLEPVVGLLASVGLFLGLAALVYKPVKMAPLGIVLALVAAIVTTRHTRLALIACVAGGIGLVGGFVVAVVTSNPLW
jgi:hypothetical protein